MPTLLEHLQEIMALPNPMDEANKKLRNTWMKVNGNVVYVVEFMLSTNKVKIYDNYSDKYDSIKVDTLKVFLPESGLYTDDYYNVMLLTKKPKRQWLKSYNEDYYDIQMIHVADNSMKSCYVQNFLNKPKKNIVVLPNRLIYFWDIYIGYVKNANSIVCNNKMFEQELIDWSKRGTF